MEELKKNVDVFVKSIEDNTDINVIQNNLSLLIAQINIFYYKYNILNNKSCSNDTNINLSDLDNISKKIRNIYPKFVELRKAYFKKIFIDKLQCDKNPNGLIDNITRSNKVQRMITELTELLYIDSNLTNGFSNSISKKNYGKVILIIFVILVILAVIIFLSYHYYKIYKQKGTTANSDSDVA